MAAGREELKLPWLLLPAHRGTGELLTSPGGHCLGAPEQVAARGGPVPGHSLPS